MIDIDCELCTGCSKCVKVCPVDALRIEEGCAELIDDCISCGVCVSACPEEAIEPVIETGDAEGLSEYRGVWIFAEQKDGELKPTGPQLLGKGKELADELGEELCAVLIGGNDIEGLAAELGSYGAEKVYVIKNEIFKDYSTEAYTTAMIRLISEYKPNVMLYGATHLGRDLAPSVAGRMGLGLTADCTDLNIDEVEDRKVLLQTRPAFGGNVMADIVCPDSRPQMATVRPHVMTPMEPDQEQDFEIIEEEIEVEDDIVRTEVIEVMKPERKGDIPVEEADVVVTGGRGVGECRDDFELLEELAGILDGTVGCSRPIVEEDIMPKSKQVGQSGKTISPKLYIVCGVSGAIQHKVGIRDSDHIIAINEDPEAPIFDVADFGIVGDLEEVVPILTQKLKEKKDS